MCTQDNRDIMTEVIAELVAAGKPFTAFTATQLGMQNGTTERHSFLKGTVHGLMSREFSSPSCEYTRTLITLADGMEAWLYHPYSYTPKDFVDGLDISTPAPASVSTPAPASVSTRCPTRKPTAPNRCCTDSEGRLQISWGDLSQIGMGLYRLVNVRESHGVLIVEPDILTSPGKTGSVYMVNRDGRVRIGSKVLRELLTIDPKAEMFDISVDAAKQQLRILVMT